LKTGNQLKTFKKFKEYSKKTTYEEAFTKEKIKSGIALIELKM
jgi:hypothetical protein